MSQQVGITLSTPIMSAITIESGAMMSGGYFLELNRIGGNALSCLVFGIIFAITLPRQRKAVSA